MKSKDIDVASAGLLAGLFIGLIIGAALGILATNRFWQDDAIANGKAQHNPTTGKVE